MDDKVIRAYRQADPEPQAGFLNLKGNLFDQRDHENQRDFRAIPRALSVQPG